MIIPDIKQLNILLIEDSLIEAKKVINLLNQLNIKQVELAKSYREAVRVFDEKVFDIILADIFLGKQKKRGDDFIRYIRNRKFTTPVIYLTSFYQEKIYNEVRDTMPRCFLSKEISLLSLRQALELGFSTSPISTTSPPPKVNISHLFVKEKTSYKAILLDKVTFFSTKHKMTFVHLEDKKYIINLTLKELEEQLANIHFIRVHRGYLVNLNYMETIDLKQSQITINGDIIPVGNFYRKQLLEHINIFN